jgi:hypothetical protein
MKKEPKSTKRLQPLSLYPLSLEEVVKAIMKTPPLTKKLRIRRGKGSVKKSKKAQK